jgi:hypothetical protein
VPHGWAAAAGGRGPAAVALAPLASPGWQAAGTPTCACRWTLSALPRTRPVRGLNDPLGVTAVSSCRVLRPMAVTAAGPATPGAQQLAPCNERWPGPTVQDPSSVMAFSAHADGGGSQSLEGTLQEAPGQGMVSPYFPPQPIPRCLMSISCQYGRAEGLRLCRGLRGTLRQEPGPAAGAAAAGQLAHLYRSPVCQPPAQPACPRALGLLHGCRAA